LRISWSVSGKLYATWNPGGEIDPGSHEATPFKDQDAFDRIIVPPVSQESLSGRYQWVSVLVAADH
jgi:hypothetical protein